MYRWLEQQRKRERPYGTSCFQEPRLEKIPPPLPKEYTNSKHTVFTVPSQTPQILRSDPSEDKEVPFLSSSSTEERI